MGPLMPVIGVEGFLWWANSHIIHTANIYLTERQRTAGTDVKLSEQM